MLLVLINLSRNFIVMRNLDNCSTKLAVLIIVRVVRGGYSWEFDENEPRSSNIQTPERLADD